MLTVGWGLLIDHAAHSFMLPVYTHEPPSAVVVHVANLISTLWSGSCVNMSVPLITSTL